jgi:hypothetical protein
MKRVRMYNRLGWVDVSEYDALETCSRLPAEWTLQKWVRPEGFPDHVNVPAAWPEITARQSIDLARQIDASLEIRNKWVADEVIRKFVDGTKHPDLVNT